MYAHPHLAATWHREWLQRRRGGGRRPVDEPPEPPNPPRDDARRRTPMDTAAALTRFEATIDQQVSLAAGDAAVETAARMLVAALAPAARELAMDLAQQAAAELGAQLSDQEVDVVLRDGEPALVVRPAEAGEEPAGGEEYEARLTLRLPPSLKAVVEEHAGAAGDSVNSWVVTSLARQARRSGRRGGSVRGVVQT